MGKFFKENWLFMLLPILIVLGVVLYLALSGSGEGPSSFNGYEL
ncbi:MAG: hypothetical protein P1V35_16790 [Planctomycetota bacterium]|nr:hypothetical protein [Planctomycetota bacterium]